MRSMWTAFITPLCFLTAAAGQVGPRAGRSAV
jgi:hypothetical protein